MTSQTLRKRFAQVNAEALVNGVLFSIYIFLADIALTDKHDYRFYALKSSVILHIHI